MTTTSSTTTPAASSAAGAVAGCRGVPEVAALLGKRLDAQLPTWVAAAHTPAETPAGESPEGSSVTWPMRISLGKPDAALLTRAFPAVNSWALAWRDAVLPAGVTVTWTTRLVHGARHQLPTHVVLPDLTAAAALAGGAWPVRTTRAQSWWTVLHTQLPETASPAALRALLGCTDVDAELVVTTAEWLRAHPHAGMTARQLPIAGVHAKWVDAHLGLLQTLSGHEQLELLRRPTRIHFTYLDPGHLAAGGRAHDSFTFGDTAVPAYRPRVVVISENKDTAVLFPHLPGAVSVEGNGNAAAALLPHVPWIADAEHVVYWGDLDRHGFEILDALRGRGVPAVSVLMDEAAYEAYRVFGVTVDARGRTLTAGDGKELLHLTAAERAVYERLVDPAFDGPRRVEQERIPLEVAHAAVQALLRDHPVR